MKFGKNPVSTNPGTNVGKTPTPSASTPTTGTTPRPASTPAPTHTPLQAASRPVTRLELKPGEPTPQAIAEAAYFLWQKRGGNETVNWLEAEATLRRTRK
jgi:hypothetical protein